MNPSCSIISSLDIGENLKGDSIAGAKAKARKQCKGVKALRGKGETLKREY